MGISDFIEWTEVRPKLNGSPLTIFDVELIQQSAVTPLSPEDDYYTPSIVGTDEEDIVLVYNHSGGMDRPSIRYTGRKGSGLSTGGTASVINGTHTTTAPWGKYSACAVSLNSVTRGTIWCSAEYTGATADPGWNTRLINLRAE